MGSFFSKNKKITKFDILKEEFEYLKSKISDFDKNDDGIISKDEFENWNKVHSNKISKIKTKYTAQIEDLNLHFSQQLDSVKEIVKTSCEEKYNTELMDQKIQLEASLKKIKELEDHITFLSEPKTEMCSFIIGEDDIKNDSTLSTKRINEIVEKLLSNEKVNIKLLPDGIERQIYRNVISLAMELIKETLSTSKISFMGHEIKFIVRPSIQKV